MLEFSDNNIFAPAPKSEIETLSDNLAAKEAEQAEIQDRIAADEASIKEMNAEIERIRDEANRQMSVLAMQRSELEVKIRDDRRRIKELESEIYEMRKRLRMLEDALMQEAKFREAESLFAERTANAAWRDYALPHQWTGAALLANAGRGILGDKMGLGKTLTILATADMLDIKRLLIVAPADVVKNFEREVHRWAPHRSPFTITMYKMSKAERDMTFTLLKQFDQFTVLINYEAWRKDAELVDMLCELGFQGMILDEAHVIKETTSLAFKGVRRIMAAENCCPVCSGKVVQEDIDKYNHYFHCVACPWDTRYETSWDLKDRRSVKYVFPMSGTPILNRPDELFPLLHLVFPEIFVKVEDFRILYCMQGLDNKWKFKPGALDSLQSHLAGHYVARDRNSAGVVIPKQTVNYIEIPLSDVEEYYPTQYKYMQMLSKHAQIVLESGQSLLALYAITLILRKRQMNVWPGGINLKDGDGNIVFSVGDEVTESIKMDRAFELLTDLAGDGMQYEGERCVVFSQFKDPLKSLCSRLNAAGIPSVVFDGDTPDSVREQIKMDFDRKTMPENPKWQIVLCNYKTGGVGLNFTGATQIVALDEEWNPGKNEQAWGRIDRVGQTQETTVNIFRIANTIDTWMAGLIENKAEIVGGFDEATKLDLLNAMKNGEIL